MSDTKVVTAARGVDYGTTATLTTIVCGECGGIYAITARYRAEKQEAGGTWNCPYCRSGWGYANNNENARLKARISNLEGSRSFWVDQAKDHEDRADTEARRARAYKGHLGRTRKRIGSGTCPCCNRHFQNLGRHMKGQHPEYGKETT